jgi:hypothetical protein
MVQQQQQQQLHVCGRALWSGTCSYRRQRGERKLAWGTPKSDFPQVIHIHLLVLSVQAVMTEKKKGAKQNLGMGAGGMPAGLTM